MDFAWDQRPQLARVQLHEAAKAACQGLGKRAIPDDPHQVVEKVGLLPRPLPVAWRLPRAPRAAAAARPKRDQAPSELRTPPTKT